MGLDQVREDWTRLGAADPLWAVLVSPEHRHGRWDPEQFLATGRAEVAAVLAQPAALGMPPGTAARWTSAAVPAGCPRALAHVDAGRRRRHLADDARARPRAGTRGDRFEFVLNDRPDLSGWLDGSLRPQPTPRWCSASPQDSALGYLAEMVRVLRPGRRSGRPAGHDARCTARRACSSGCCAARRCAARPATCARLPGADGHVPDDDRAGDRRPSRARRPGHSRRVAEPMYGGNWRYRALLRDASMSPTAPPNVGPGRPPGRAGPDAVARLAVRRPRRPVVIAARRSWCCSARSRLGRVSAATSSSTTSRSPAAADHSLTDLHGFLLMSYNSHLMPGAFV